MADWSKGGKERADRGAVASTRPSAAPGSRHSSPGTGAAPRSRRARASTTGRRPGASSQQGSGAWISVPSGMVAFPSEAACGHLVGQRRHGVVREDQAGERGDGRLLQRQMAPVAGGEGERGGGEI